MARVKRSVQGKKHRRAILEQASRVLRRAEPPVPQGQRAGHALGRYAFRDRRARKGEFRRLWIVRINAACRQHDISLLALRRGSEGGRDRGRPQGPRRSRGPRRRGLRRAGHRGSRGARSSLSAPLGPRHLRVKRLRRAHPRPEGAPRRGRCSCIEGPTLLDAALEHGIPLESFYLAPGAERAFAPLVARLRAAGAPDEGLKEGVLERIGDTVTPQPILAVARIPAASLDELSGSEAVRARPSSSRSTCRIPGTRGRSCAAPGPPGRQG